MRSGEACWEVAIKTANDSEESNPTPVRKEWVITWDMASKIVAAARTQKAMRIQELWAAS